MKNYLHKELLNNAQGSRTLMNEDNKVKANFISTVEPRDYFVIEFPSHI